MRNDRSAAAIYAAQNRLMHSCFAAAGFPYSDDPDVWRSWSSGVLRTQVTSLSALTLSERWQLLRALGASGHKIRNPWVPPRLRTWRKGDTDVSPSASPVSLTSHHGRPSETLFRDPSKGALLSKIEAFLLSTGRPWSYANSMAQHMFKIEFVQWCDGAQLHKIVAALTYDARRRDSHRRVEK